MSARIADEDEHQPFSRLDQAERRAIVLPREEELLLHTVWVAEAYGPGTIDVLTAGLKALGLLGDTPFSLTAETVQAVRRRALAFAASELPRLTAEESAMPAWSIFGSVQSELPVGVHRVHPHWLSVSPSLSVLVCGFDFDPVASRQPHEVLAADHPGRSTPLPDGGTSHLPPSEMQGQRFRRALAEALDGPRAWLRDRMPGEFTALGIASPGGELITARLFDPFDPDETRGGGIEAMWSYRYGAELGSGTQQLRNTANRALSVSTARDSEGRVLWFGGKVDAIAQGWSGDSSRPDYDHVRAVVGSAARRLAAPMAIHAVACLVDDLYAALAQLRDEPPARRGARRPRRQRAALRHIPLLVDSRHIADDLADGVPSRALGGYDGSDFTAAPRAEGLPAQSFGAGHLEAIKRGAGALDESERRARDAVEVRAGLHAAIAAVDATRLAVVAVLLAVVAVVATVVVAAIDKS